MEPELKDKIILWFLLIGAVVVLPILGYYVINFLYMLLKGI